MPLDAEPSPDGNVEVTEDRHRLLVIAVHPSPPIFAETLYMPHHATCPDAADWKQR